MKSRRFSPDFKNIMVPICPDFKWSRFCISEPIQKSRPFATQPLFDHSKSRLVHISDPHCIQMPFKVCTIIRQLDTLYLVYLASIGIPTKLIFFSRRACTQLKSPHLVTPGSENCDTKCKLVELLKKLYVNDFVKYSCL